MKVFGRCVIVLALVAAACDQAGTSTELARPSAVPASLVTFTGTLQVAATNSYQFNVAQDGYVQATLVGLGAPAGTAVGFGIGTLSTTGVCSLLQSVTTPAGPTAQLLGTGLAGRLCVSIYDVGNLTTAAIYTITVAAS
jgi:hypothetical protein